MEGMFGQFDNLSNLDLISIKYINDVKELKEFFYTKKVIYLRGCINLNILNLSSSFSTQNVINIASMFSACFKLNNLNYNFF